tara:strand:+ start:414 stop:614 length:201 start_codon:yes stop_codon:yes gene_type:complete
MRLVPAHKDPVISVEQRVVTNAQTLAQLERYKNRPADLQQSFSATPKAETVQDFLYKNYTSLDELG